MVALLDIKMEAVQYSAMSNRWTNMARILGNRSPIQPPKPRDPGGLDAYGKWHPTSYFDEKIAFEAEQKRLGNPSGDDIMNVAKNMAYFTPVIGAATTLGDAGTAFEKGDVGGGALNTAFAFGSLWMPGLFKMLGSGAKGLFNSAKTGIATMEC